MSISWRRKKSASIATFVGDDRPLIFNIAILMCSIPFRQLGGVRLLFHTLSLFSCDAVVLFLLRSCGGSWPFSNFIFLYGFEFFLESPSLRLALVCPFFSLGILLPLLVARLLCRGLLLDVKIVGSHNKEGLPVACECLDRSGR